jgi:toxin FitB
MIVLDTNVLSELTRSKPDEAALAWADSVHGPAVATTAVTVAEMLYGIARLPDGRRKTVMR